MRQRMALFYLAINAKYEYNEIINFVDRMRELVMKTRDMGWGYHDTLGYLFDQAYGKLEQTELWVYIELYTLCFSRKFYHAGI